MAEEELRRHVAARGGVGLAVDAQHELVTRTHAVTLLDSDGGIRRVLVEMDFDMPLTINNIILGLSVSAIIGIVSGFVPAFTASRLDPVEAIRANG